MTGPQQVSEMPTGVEQRSDRSEEIDLTEGAGALETGWSLYQDLTSDDVDPLALGVDAVSFGLDFLDTAFDPLGAVAEAGVGWLLEHVEILREPLEVLTGDPGQITSLSGRWAQIAQELDDVAEEFAASQQTLAAWDGRAATGYRRAAAAHEADLRGAAEHVRHVGQGIAAAGVVVATERGVLFNLISSFVSDVITQALIAAASSVVTLGGSVAAFLTRLTMDVAAFAAKIQARLARLLRALSDFARRFRSAGHESRQVANTLLHKSNRLCRQANSVLHNTEKAARSLGPAESSRLGRYVSRAERLAESTRGRVLDHPLTDIGQEGAKAVKEAVSPPDESS